MTKSDIDSLTLNGVRTFSLRPGQSRMPEWQEG